MRAARGALAFAGMAMLTLAACGGGEPRLMNLRASGPGPDEFAILPTKVLSTPASFAELPVPTPGGTNLTDPTPDDDAIVALGGKPQAGLGVPAADGALLSHAVRYGRSPDIRSSLAAEDLAFRSDNKGRVLERLLNVNVYFNAYKPQSLDQDAELARWRRLGYRTVSAPPPKSQ
ncbi:MAG: DUF3035 domain-containing protein [Paracoccaceae bacterium]|nr:DUF3035 domain-containing protein [Paracoccaceae bacterium]